ncbi:MAG: DUF1302 domain-containing protein [Candidatus Pelagadaptatus aseana]|uniref:DUF1302 domain-containing protein n=1 Tax=Candidatus Pelagadaptatus aseana TaxID=3120508 RepID=UPI0039B1683F
MRKRALAAAVLAGMATQASAFQFDTNEDWDVRWDNTFKYNLIQRVADYDEDVVADTFTADSDRSFEKNDIVSNRVDLLSELDVVWKDTLGFRVSAAAWYDHAYKNDMNSDDIDIVNWGTAKSTLPGELTDRGEKYHHQGGELLDAFVFWNWELGDVQGNLRAGRHVIYWGQSLLGTAAINSAGGAMNPLDFSKALSVPGSEAKELFMPTNKISTLMQLTDNLSFSAYYSLEYQHTRLPTGNSYFSPSTGFTDDYETFFLAPDLGYAAEIHDDEEPGSGEWGVNFSYYFEDLGMEVSAFYLNYHDKIQNGLTASLNPLGLVVASQGVLAGVVPNLIADNIADGVTDARYINAPGADQALILADGTVASSIGDAKWVYKADIDLYGLSFSKQIGDISYGLDIVHRRDMPIRVDLNSVVGRSASELVATGFATTFTYADFLAADEDNYPQNTGDTWHVVINALGLLNDNGWWEGGSYIIEATFNWVEDIDYSRQPEYLTLVTQDLEGSGNIYVDEGRIASHLAVLFRPTWYQVFPGVDLTVPVSVSIGIDGNGTSSFLGDEESGSASIGLDFNVNQTWSAAIKYNSFFGPVDNGFGNRLKDRDNISLTFKRTF